MQPTLYDLALYYRDNGLVGEDAAAVTSTLALLGDAPVIWRGYPGTGKTIGADICVSLLPDEVVTSVDMLSKLGIWSSGMVDRINNARIVYFPEDQNAGDNDEVVKVKKKWGDGKRAERGKSENYGNDTTIVTLPCRTFISTAAITNKAHEESFDLESARRVVKVNTNPSDQATSEVLAAKAARLVHGAENVRHMTTLDAMKVRRHTHRAMVMNHSAVKDVRFFGAHEVVAAVPRTFPEARSAFSLYERVLLGTARWYADDEVVVDGEAFLSPGRVAETWAIYGDVLIANALKWDTSDREILSAFPQPVWNGAAIAPECSLDMKSVMAKLQPFGLTDPSLVKKQISRLEMKGFLMQQEGIRITKWHRTTLADVANFVDWPKLVSVSEEHAQKYLADEPLDRFLKLCEQARGPKAMRNPITGDVGPIFGEGAVLYYDTLAKAYAGVDATKKKATVGLAGFGDSNA